VSVFLTAGPVDKIAGLVRQGNAHELSALFAADIEVAIMDKGDITTRATAETAVAQFFKEHTPQSVSPLHSINSNPDFNFQVLLLTTNKGVYRVAYTLKKDGSNWLIIELRIEAEKVK
jgi:hypothetical protein